MKKEEVIDKINQDDVDESINFAKELLTKLGNLIISALVVVLFTLSIIFRATTAFNAVSSLYFAYLAIDQYRTFQFEGKKKLYLFGFILSAILSIIGIVNFISALLKK